jgi:hypothetical protein
METEATPPPPGYADQDSLIDALSRMVGLASALKVILECEGDQRAQKDALRAVGESLSMETEKLLAAAERGEVSVAPPTCGE